MNNISARPWRKPRRAGSPGEARPAVPRRQPWARPAGRETPRTPPGRRGAKTAAAKPPPSAAPGGGAPARQGRRPQPRRGARGEARPGGREERGRPAQRDGAKRARPPKRAERSEATQATKREARRGRGRREGDRGAKRSSPEQRRPEAPAGPGDRAGDAPRDGGRAAAPTGKPAAAGRRQRPSGTGRGAGTPRPREARAHHFCPEAKRGAGRLRAPPPSKGGGRETPQVQGIKTTSRLCRVSYKSPPHFPREPSRRASARTRWLLRPSRSSFGGVAPT